MRVVAHHTKNYDWVPVPGDVQIKAEDYAAGLVKPSMQGSPRMRITRNVTNHTVIHITEADIVGQIVFERCRPSGGRMLTRKQAVAFFIAENVLDHHTQKAWLTRFEVDDSGHDETLARQVLQAHVAAGNIEAEEVDAHMAAYTESALADDHVAQLHKHFKIKVVTS